MKTDDRAALIVGTVLWLLVAVAAVVFAAPLTRTGHGWVVAAAIIGVALGLVGVVYAQLTRMRRR
jgi:hypothetical protein